MKSRRHALWKLALLYPVTLGEWLWINRNPWLARKPLPDAPGAFKIRFSEACLWGLASIRARALLGMVSEDPPSLHEIALVAREEAERLKMLRGKR